jgi:chaperonin cofactor prefoldin
MLFDSKLLQELTDQVEKKIRDLEIENKILCATNEYLNDKINKMKHIVNSED